MNLVSHLILVLFVPVQSINGPPWWSRSKEYTCNTGEAGSIPGLGRAPGGGHGNPLQYSCLENPHGQRSCLENPHGQRSLAGYRPLSCKESDTTEHIMAVTNVYFYFSLMEFVSSKVWRSSCCYWSCKLYRCDLMAYMSMLLGLRRKFLSIHLQDFCFTFI